MRSPVRRHAATIKVCVAQGTRGPVPSGWSRTRSLPSPVTWHLMFPNEVRKVCNVCKVRKLRKWPCPQKPISLPVVAPTYFRFPNFNHFLTFHTSTDSLQVARKPRLPMPFFSIISLTVSSLPFAGTDKHVNGRPTSSSLARYSFRPSLPSFLQLKVPKVAYFHYFPNSSLLPAPYSLPHDFLH